MSTLPPVYIVAATRTPIGAFADLAAPRLGAVAIKAALERAGVAPDAVNEVFMGNVLSAGIGRRRRGRRASSRGSRTRSPAPR